MARRKFTLVCPGRDASEIRWERVVGDQPLVVIEDPRLLLSFMAVVEEDGFDEITRIVFGPGVGRDTVDRFVAILTARNECEIVHLSSGDGALHKRISRTGKPANRILDSFERGRSLSWSPNSFSGGLPAWNRQPIASDLVSDAEGKLR